MLADPLGWEADWPAKWSDAFATAPRAAPVMQDIDFPPPAEAEGTTLDQWAEGKAIFASGASRGVRLRRSQDRHC